MTTETPALSIEKLKRHFLECTICKEQYDDKEKHPRVLPCLHSFCYSCLKRLIEQTKYTCPLCNSDFKTENTVADRFPKDNTRRDLLDFVHAADENTFLPCDECDENEKAVARCKDCFNFLGENCLKAHKSMRTFAKHRVFTLRDVTFDVNSISDFRSAGICSNHDEVLKLYCAGKKCQAPICHSCCLTSHMDDNNHVRRNIDEVYNEKKERLLEKEIKLKDMANDLDQLSSKVVQALEYLDENSNEVESEITAIFQTAIEMLQRRRDYLVKETKEIKKEKRIVLQKQKEEIGFLSQHINDACDFLNQSLASKNQAAFLFLSNTIAERFEYLLNTDFNKIPHDANLINFQKCNLGAYFQLIVNILGGVTSTTAYSLNTVVNIPNTVKKDEVFEFELSFYDFTNYAISEKVIVAYTLFDDKNEVITDCEEKLMIEDDLNVGKYKTSCTIADDTKSISRLSIKLNGNAFHCIILNTTVEDRKEKSTNGTEIKISVKDREIGLSDQRKEYVVTDEKNEDTYTEQDIEEISNEQEKHDASSVDIQKDTPTGYAEDSTASDDGKEDTLTMHTKETLLNEDGNELSDYGVEKTATMQTLNEKQLHFVICKSTFIEDIFEFIEHFKAAKKDDIYLGIESSRGGCRKVTVVVDQDILSKYNIVPENELLLCYKSDKKRHNYLYHAEIERSGECIAGITIINCKECKQICMTIISVGNLCLNHQPVFLPVGIYVNRHNHYMLVYCYSQSAGKREKEVIWSIPIKTDGIYVCTVKTNI